MYKYSILFFITAFLVLFGCKKSPNTTIIESQAKLVKEINPIEIILDGEVSSPKKEISGLAWYNNKLFLLPQNPLNNEDTLGYLYYINKNRIISYLDSTNLNPILPEKIKIIGAGLKEFNTLGSGFEAITFYNDKIYLTVEISTYSETFAYLIKGEINFEQNSIILDNKNLIKVKPNSNIENHSEEAIGIWNSKLFTIHELNGRNIVKSPIIHLYDFDLNFLETKPFPFLEYRITDITKPDSSGKFWGLNYFWPGDYADQKPADDSLVSKYGVGETHKKFATVERLIEFQFKEDGVVLTETPPIQLKLLNNNKSRNWEGIAKLNNLGFLIITDMFPTTILSFVPSQQKNDEKNQD